ncbi:MAG TPA: DUF167 domain-containing protein [Thermodesulfobium narugense]|uniref:UPF0235 protein TDSAC_1053 n=1 Tax=Thermodesulfobium acidiphilum TaxID=1794699 RepID=A0A2R4W125_THEAF|nr:DUF167 domain-containing protein [Thermodesulfobium acidiphilum]AWB10406.1 hypothetical protein TDSAC_1053 [Thermodesulfobium acidiphilum]PMP85850.1 MAG: hypothetical protein C0174_03185 [Thermodesulfobium narugense]HEM55672.1 DUF167 domain-containing protein [Thermodesulfobium narugense]
MDYKVELRVTPNAKKEAVEIKDGIIYCKVSVPPEDGRANKRVIELISEFFDCKRKDVEIFSGKKSKNKILLIKSENILKKIKDGCNRKI